MPTVNANIRWADNTTELTAHLKQGLDQIEATRAGAEKMAAALGGGKLIQAAHNYVAALQKAGGVEKLTAAERERGNALLDKTIAKYQALGQTAPAALLQVSAALKTAIGQTQTFEERSAALGKQLTAIGGAARTAGIGLTAAITAPLVGVGVTALHASMEFENSFAGVKKTVDGVVDQFGKLTPAGEKLQQQFRDLAKVLPVNVNELNRIGEAAGQLGIKQKDILQFTEVMAKLGVTTNLTSDQAANAIARIQNIYGAAGVDTDRLASSIVALGNAGASTESEIVEFGLRIAGAGKLAGLAQADVLGIGSAMASIGVEAEAGGTAVQKVLLNMVTAVTTGNADLAVFAKTAGLSAAEFAKAFKDDAGGAFTAFVEGLSKQGNQAIGTLSKLGLEDARLVRSFLSLAGAGDLLRVSLKDSNKAWEENTALTKEAAIRFATTANQLLLFKAQVNDISISIGNILSPKLADFSQSLGPIVGGVAALATEFEHSSEASKLLVIGVAGIASSIGPALLAVGGFAFALNSINTTLIAFPGATAAVAGAIGSMGGAMAGWVTAFFGAEAGVTVLASSLVGLGTVLLAGATGWLTYKAAAAAFDWLGLSDAMARVSIKAGMLTGVLPQMTEAEIEASLAAQRLGREHDDAADALQRAAIAAQHLAGVKDRLSGALASKDLSELTQVVRDFATEGTLSTAVMKRIGLEAERLQQAGGTLSPELASIVSWLERTRDAAGPAGGAMQTLADKVKALTETQRADILSKRAQKESIKAIADETGVAIEVVGMFLRQQHTGTKGVDAFADAMEELNAAGQGWQGTLASIDGTLVEAIKYYLAAGVTQAKLATAYGLTAVQVKAVADLTEMARALELDGLKKSEAEWKTWAETASKAADKVGHDIVAGAVQIQEAQREATDVIQQQSLSSRDYQVTKIWEVAEQQKGAFKGTKDQAAAFYAEIDRLAKAHVDAIYVDNDAIKANSLASLRQIADKAWATYRGMVENSADYSAATVQHFKEVAEAAEKTANGIGTSLGDRLKKTIVGIPGMLQQALLGGGGVGGALKAIGLQLGVEFGNALTEGIKLALAKKGPDGKPASVVTGGNLQAASGLGALSGAGAVAGGATTGQAFTSVGMASAGVGVGVIGAGGTIGGALALSAATLGIGAAAIGVALLIKYMMGKNARGVAAVAAYDYGVHISKEVNKAVRETMKTLHVSQQVALVLNVDQLFPTVTAQNFNQALHATRDAFVMVGRGEMTAAQGAGVLNTMWERLAAVGVDAYGRINAELRELIELDQQFGTHSSAILAFLKTQAANAAAGLEQLAGAVDYTTESLDDLSTVALMTFNAAIASGATFTQALKGISGALVTIRKAYKDLGVDISGSPIAALLRQQDIQTNDPATATGIEGLNATMTAASNIPGLMTPESFAAMQRIGYDLYVKTQAATAAAGGNTADALVGMQQWLHQARDFAARNQIELDERTQMLIGQSQDLGVWTEAIASETELLTQSMQELIKSNTDLIDALNRNARGEAPRPPAPPGTTPPGTFMPVPDAPEYQPYAFAAMGGLVTADGVQRFGGGGIVGGFRPWMPRVVGTDTVPAMLTPAELIMNVAQQGPVADVIRSGAAMAEALSRDRSPAAVANGDTLIIPVTVPAGGTPEQIADYIYQRLPDHVRRDNHGLRSDLLTALGFPVTTWTTA